MIAEKIRSVGKTLGVLAGQVTEEQWELIELARTELADAANIAQGLEELFQRPEEEVKASPKNTLGSLLAAMGPKAFSPMYTKADLRPRQGLSLVIFGKPITLEKAPQEQQPAHKEAADAQA